MASLEDRIAARLHQTLDQLRQTPTTVEAPAERGLAIGEPGQAQVLLTVEMVAWIAAEEARPIEGPAAPTERERRLADTIRRTAIPADNEVRARVRRQLADAAARYDPVARDEIRVRFGLPPVGRRAIPEPDEPK